MADESHLKVLVEDGITNWGKWRRENLYVEPDLSGVDLSKRDLRGADFNGTKLHQVNLQGADLAGVDFSGAYLKRFLSSYIRDSRREVDWDWRVLLDDKRYYGASLFRRSAGQDFAGV